MRCSFWCREVTSSNNLYCYSNYHYYKIIGIKKKGTVECHYSRLWNCNHRSDDSLSTKQGKNEKTKIHCMGNSANVGYCTIFIFRNWFNIRSYCRKRMGCLNNVVYLSHNFRNRTYSVIDWYFQEKRAKKRSRSLIKGLLFISTDKVHYVN